MSSGSYADALAIKRLSAVEVDPEASNQHEFHAGRLRTALGLSEDAAGRLHVGYFTDDAEPLLGEGKFTISNVRRGKPRSAEYHMYYSSSVIDDAAEPGDLLVVSRLPDSPDLRAVIAKAGTNAEAELLDAILARDQPVLEPFLAVDAPRLSEDRGKQLFAALAGATPTAGLEAHPVVRLAIETGALPNTRTMADAGREMAVSQGKDRDPDTFIDAALDAETALFGHIVNHLGRARLKELIDRDAPFEEFEALFMGRAQSAKSRRGLSLQHHFASILAAEGIPFEPQCATETGETADFVMPGCVQYHDSAFPAERLRMVASKSTARDRWRQVLNEAARIREKYFLTLDPDLTVSLIAKIGAAHIRLFLPRPLLIAHYPSQAGLESVGDLLGLLRAAAR